MRRSNAGIEVRREVRGEDRRAVVPLELLQQDADHGVRFALEPVSRLMSIAGPRCTGRSRQAKPRN